MPTFFRRHYARRLEAVGRTEQAVGAVILLALAGILTAYLLDLATHPGSPVGAWEAAPTAPGDRLPDPGLPDWIPCRQTEHFTADNLFEKINGRAEVYLQHQVAGLTFGSYCHQTQTGRTIDVYWFNMGRPQSAQAVYETERPAQPDPVPIGDAGYQSGTAVFFRKGASYVQVVPSGLDPADGQAARRIAELLADRISYQSADGPTSAANPGPRP